MGGPIMERFLAGSNTGSQYSYGRQNTYQRTISEESNAPSTRSDETSTLGNQPQWLLAPVSTLQTKLLCPDTPNPPPRKVSQFRPSQKSSLSCSKPNLRSFSPARSVSPMTSGRPPGLGRPAQLTVPSLGRQSPLILTKVPYSPVTRRTRKVSTNPQMRKSLSLDNVRVQNFTPETREDFFHEKIEENEDVANEQESAVSANSEKVETVNFPSPDTHAKPAKFNEVLTRVGDNFCSSYSSLPRPVSRSKSITRSLVPKMRQMFEKSRSCDPEWGEENSVPEPRRRFQTKDGTESTRSSFVLLETGPRASRGTLKDYDHISSSPSLDRKSKGFVNKCVTKVKSFIGKSEEKE